MSQESQEQVTPKSTEQSSNIKPGSAVVVAGHAHPMLLQRIEDGVAYLVRVLEYPAGVWRKLVGTAAASDVRLPLQEAGEHWMEDWLRDHLTAAELRTVSARERMLEIALGSLAGALASHVPSTTTETWMRQALDFAEKSLKESVLLTNAALQPAPGADVQFSAPDGQETITIEANSAEAAVTALQGQQAVTIGGNGAQAIGGDGEQAVSGGDTAK